MAVSTANKIQDTSPAADFRSWATFISAIMLAGGFTKTADTGQIDLTTVAAPTGVSQSMGYEIWQSNDTGTRFYVKIEYGSGAGGAANPGIWITVGWGTDGAGNLTGNTSTRKQIASGGNSTATAPCYASAGTARVAVAMFCGGATNAFWFAVERTRGTDGSENSTEVMLLGGTATASSVSQVVPSSGAVPTQEASVIVASPTVANALYGLLVGLQLCFAQKGGLTNPSGNVFGYPTAQIAAASQVPADVYGSTHTFIACGANPVTAATYGLLMRYE